MAPVVVTTGGTSSGSGTPRVAPTARRDPRRWRPWPSYGRARLRSMRTRRPAVIWGSRARTARRVPGRWRSGRGDRRYVREAGRYWKIFVPRLRCARCGVSHALLPAFTLAWRLDVAETIGSVVGEWWPAGGAGSARWRSGRGCRIRSPAAGSGGSGPAPRSWGWRSRRLTPRSPWRGGPVAGVRWWRWARAHYPGWQWSAPGSLTGRIGKLARPSPRRGGTRRERLPRRRR